MHLETFFEASFPRNPIQCLYCIFLNEKAVFQCEKSIFSYPRNPIQCFFYQILSDIVKIIENYAWMLNDIKRCLRFIQMTFKEILQRSIAGVQTSDVIAEER